MDPSARPVLAAALLCGICGAQAVRQAPAPRILGEVRDRAGQPWAGARVVALGRTVPQSLSSLSGEQLEVVSDARGRFRLLGLAAGRRYTLWAIGPLANGSHRASAVVEDVAAEQVVPLREVERRPQTRVVVTGLAAWAGHGPFRFRVACRSFQPAFGVDLSPDEDGVLHLPPLPGRDCVVEVIGRRCPVLATPAIPLARGARSAWRAARGDWAALATPREPLTVAVPPPYRAVVYVQTVRSRPLANVDVSAAPWDSGEWRWLGRTGDDGYIAVPLPRRQAADGLEPYSGDLLFAGAGHEQRAVRGGKVGRHRAGFAERWRLRLTDLTVNLRSGEAVGGRVLLAAGVPGADLRLRVYTRQEGGKNGREIARPAGAVLDWRQGRAVHPMQILRTDANGRFSLPGAPAKSHLRITALPEPRHLRHLPQSAGYPMADELVIAVLKTGSERRDLGTVRLDRLASLDLELRGVDGAPVERPVFALLERSLGTAEAVVVAGDRIGRVRLLVPPDRRWLVAGFTAGGGACELVEDLRAPVSLRMDPRLRVTGAVVDVDGRPLPGTRVGLARLSPLDDVPGLLLHKLRNLLLVHGGCGVNADATGRFALVLPCGGMEWELRAALPAPYRLLIDEDPRRGLAVTGGRDR